MKKLLIGIITLGSISAFANEGFNCTQLKKLNSGEIDLAVKMARYFSTEQISKNLKDVSAQIRAERNLEEDLSNCKIQAIDAQIEELRESLKD